MSSKIAPATVWGVITSAGTATPFPLRLRLHSKGARTASVVHHVGFRLKKHEVTMSQLKKIYRVDKFVVPESSRDEFLSRILDTHKILRVQPGFLQDSILEQNDGPGRYNIVTVAEWESQEAIDSAKKVVQAEHAKSGFSPQQTMERLGVQADIANYIRVNA
jgi:heme-degrading monooxygenase HmoA